MELIADLVSIGLTAWVAWLLRHNDVAWVLIWLSEAVYLAGTRIARALDRFNEALNRRSFGTSSYDMNKLVRAIRGEEDKLPDW